MCITHYCMRAAVLQGQIWDFLEGANTKGHDIYNYISYSYTTVSIPQYEYNIVAITRVRGKAKYEC